jgi:cytochrome c peroxidase
VYHDKLKAFLDTLTGKQPQLNHPILPANSDASPRPISN